MGVINGNLFALTKLEMISRTRDLIQKDYIFNIIQHLET